MTKRRNIKDVLYSKTSKRILIALGAFSLLFLGYCLYLFQNLDSIMSQQPALEKPSIIYSDIFIIKKGDFFSNTALKERLEELKINLNENNSVFSFKEKNWDVPESILPLESQLRIAGDAQVQIEVADDIVQKIIVNSEEKEAYVIEPTPIARLSGSTTEIREYLPLDQIPTRLLQAIIAIEDQRFLEHVGFDPRGLARAIWINLRRGSMSQGGSTLTQQLIKNLLGTRQKTITRKMKELVLAFLIEMKYSKEQILEKYLNELYFGQVGAMEIHGVSEAARYFFNKQLDRLSLAECAILAGIVRGPYFYSPYRAKERTLERQQTVLKKMAELKLISTSELNSAVKEKINFAPPLTGINKAPYFVDFVKAQILDELSEKISRDVLTTEGLKVYSTLDLPIQRRADEAVFKNVTALEAKYKIQRPLRLEGLLVASEPATGFVRALVGGRSYNETSFNRVLNMRRSVGSSFKPIVYLTGFMKGTDSQGNPIHSAWMVDDEPWSYEYDKKKWSPKNYEKAYRGKITLREAFVNSINIPMAKLATDLGVDLILDTAEKLGLGTELPRVPSIALGSVSLSSSELLSVYNIFANMGENVDLTTVRVITDANGVVIAKFNPQATQVFERKYFTILNELLHAVTTEGTSKALPQLGYDKFSYGKTGTTNFYRDAWFTGFSQGLSAVTWVGFDELKIPDEEDVKAVRKFKSPALLTGAGTALPIWASFYKGVFPSAHSKPEPDPDTGLETARISRKSGCVVDPSKSEEEAFTSHFLAGTTPNCKEE